MLNDDRCRRVMKKIRKRRRQKNGKRRERIGIEGSDVLKKPSFSRTMACRVTDEKGNEKEIFEEESNYRSVHSNPIFSRYFPQRINHKRRHHNHENQECSRRNHIDWGESLARRRAFSSFDGEDKRGDRKMPLTSEPELVHRKPESIHTFSYYCSCTFLDLYDKVLAVDNRGTLDLIRLADMRSQTQAHGKGGKKTLASHEKLVANFELGAELQQQSFSTVHVQALSGGITVAFGLEDDSLCLLDLERRINRYVDAGRRYNEVLTPVSLSKGEYYSSSLSLLLTASRTKHPRRTHYRDRRNPRLSLHELCSHRMNKRSKHSKKHANGSKSTSYTNVQDDDDISELLAIDYTTGRGRIASPVRFLPGVRPPHDARWDILELHPCEDKNSLLYVAHVDSDYDAFWTQVIDGRIRAATAATATKSNRNKCNPTTVLIDSTSKDCYRGTEEHVTACAMVTDICMATAHISCSNYGSTPASEFFDHGLPYGGYSGMSSCLKLWDLRMVKKIKAKESLIPADTMVFSVPPFKRADFAVVEPSVTIKTRLTSGEDELAFSEATFADENCVHFDFDDKEGSSIVCSDRVITNLSAARDPYHGPSNNGSARSGSLIVTTQSRTKSTLIEHSKLDLSGTMPMTRKIFQTNSNFGCQPVYAIASSHEYLATCSDTKHRTATGSSDNEFCSRSSKVYTRLCLYDLNESHTPTKSATSEDCYYSKSLRWCQQREDPTWSFQVDASLTDRYGVDTELSCIAMNHNGTALLGGTADGDLFLWRGI